MRFLKTGTNIGQIISSRTRGYPVWQKLPKKEPRRKPTCWILCPDYWVKAPKTIIQTASEKDYSFSIKIFSETRAECSEALDHMIRCGQTAIQAGDKAFWLYAVNHSIVKKGLFLARLTYIFRVSKIPDEIS